MSWNFEIRCSFLVILFRCFIAYYTHSPCRFYLQFRTLKKKTCHNKNEVISDRTHIWHIRTYTRASVHKVSTRREKSDNDNWINRKWSEKVHGMYGVSEWVSDVEKGKKRMLHRYWKLLAVQQCDIIAFHYVFLLLDKEEAKLRYISFWSFCNLAVVSVYSVFTFSLSPTLSFSLLLLFPFIYFLLYFCRRFWLLCSAAGNGCCAIQLILHEKWKLLLNVLYFGLIFYEEFTYMHCALVVLSVALVY